jgi:glutathione peroxidase
MTDTLTAIPLKTISGAPATLADYTGKALLVVNVASKCGLTPQYEGLEALYQRYHDKGFEILGFPANDFAGQEPGTDDEIQSFCSLTYDVHFPMFSKVVATGPDKHPLYQALTAAKPAYDIGDGSAMRENLGKHGITATQAPEVLWNFEKFLVGRDGTVLGRFSPDTKPDDAALVGAVEAALG